MIFDDMLNKVQGIADKPLLISTGFNYYCGAVT